MRGSWRWGSGVSVLILDTDVVLDVSLVHHPVLILGLAVLALATVVSRKPWLTPKRLIYRTHVLRLDDALERLTYWRLKYLVLSLGAGGFTAAEPVLLRQQAAFDFCGRQQV
ncbi:hypothetical protein Pla52n_33990 [Stieleria varia]|uniref:Uncharacterized protein n=1 Tax=Stieleria varia TaxID=2528005 RepID=A0A5C6ASU5_9BACT|nr:hypothetical protein Pla52n_33990 [Stieleria varia]